MRVNPANLLSLSRVFLALLGVWIIFSFNFKERFLIVMTIIIIAVITDYIDGKRASYLILKMLAWCGIMIVAYISGNTNVLWPLVWLTVIISLLRLMPNIIAGWRNIIFLKE